METIATNYLGIAQEKVDDLSETHGKNRESFKRHVLIHWKKQSGRHNKQVRKHLINYFVR